MTESGHITCARCLEDTPSKYINRDYISDGFGLLCCNCVSKSLSSNLDTIRRIAERGLKAAQKQKNSEMVDLWQHLLDELRRINND